MQLKKNFTYLMSMIRQSGAIDTMYTNQHAVEHVSLQCIKTFNPNPPRFFSREKDFFLQFHARENSSLGAPSSIEYPYKTERIPLLS